MGLLPKAFREVRWRLVLSVIIAFVVLTACGKTDNQEFTELTDTFFQEWPALHPVEATHLGLHSFDHLLVVPTDSLFTDRSALAQSILAELEDLNPQKLSTQNRIDYYQFINGLQYRLFLTDTLRIQKWSPLVYTELLEAAFSPVQLSHEQQDSTRAVALLQRLKRVPTWLANTLTILENPSGLHINAAATQADRIAADLSKHRLTEQFVSLAQSQIIALQEAESTAAGALTDFAEALRKRDISETARSARLGSAYYQRQYQYVLQTDWTPEITLERAENALRTLQDEMYTAAASLANQWWSIRYRSPSRAQKLRLIQRVLNTIDNDRPEADQIVSYMRSQTGQLDDFTRQHKILSISPDQQIDISNTSGYVSGFPLVSLMSPPPMSSTSHGTILVQPIPHDWSQSATRSFLEEYNNYALQLQVINAGIPGKFVQQNYSNRFPSLVRALFANQTMVNGWAHYVERMIVDEGWGQANQSMRVTQLKWEIRRVLQTIIDQKAHSGEMTESEALALLNSEGFMETGPAKELWRQILLHPGEASTDYVGKALILDLRHRYAQRQAQNFSLNQFHKQLLSFGSPPIKHLRSLLLTGDL